MLLGKANYFQKVFPFFSSPPTFFTIFFLDGELKVHEGRTHLLQMDA